MPVLMMPRGRRRRAVLALILLSLPFLAWRLFRPPWVEVRVEARHWQREVEIEKHVLESDSGPCSAMPATVVGEVVRARQADGQELCRYRSPQWRRRWSLLAEGDLPRKPQWPIAALSSLPPAELDAERVGKRLERYELKLLDEQGRDWHCALPQAQWAAVADQASYRLRVDRYGVGNCATLEPR
ncbi:hypothetical protein [Pelomonas sp. SE-A7]|uniref:hypothetical protein n=1 Tax=Pelomonas sp. SE-A7 TaxID=3054953 RepID=UPI00259C8D89|nr:hypothetical protein [Pelomonas sp. SE-A7]MDM4766105.1 hypothetical protein [Pelomonas sp. SE-A7]